MAAMSSRRRPSIRAGAPMRGLTLPIQPARSAGLAARPCARTPSRADLGTRAGALIRGHRPARCLRPCGARSRDRSTRRHRSRRPQPRAQSRALPPVSTGRRWRTRRDRSLDRLVDACHRNGLVKDDGLRVRLATIRSGSRAGLAVSALAIGCRMTDSAPIPERSHRRVPPRSRAAGKRRIILVAPTGSGQDRDRAPTSSAARRCAQKCAGAGASARDHRADQREAARRSASRTESFRPASRRARWNACKSHRSRR